nr:uncharacterized protein LOC117228324 [Megalopta genalis]XP_033341794.1 uncharacterized protein LOC117229447 [Megalopta genalis]
MGRRKPGSKGHRSSKAKGGQNASKEENNGEERFDEKRNYRKAKDIIDVYSRLSYPLVRQNLPEDLEDATALDGSDEEDATFELTVKPRVVFVTCLCSVCMERSNVFCERCRMVSYCSRAHRSQAANRHRELCKALSEIRASIATKMSASDGSKERFNGERYRFYRIQWLENLESRLGRELHLWEKEVVLYPRVCRVCYRFDDSMPSCAACGMECFCPDHREEHEKSCREFQLLQRCLYLQRKHGSAEPKIPRRGREESEFAASSLPDVDFDELTHRIYGDCAYYREMDCYTYSMLSHLCTIPLTTLYAMQICALKCRKKSELLVHVLGAEFQFEGMNLHVWEQMFLHFLPYLKRFRLMLVGPELQLPCGVPVQSLSRIKLCSECKAADRDVGIRFVPKTLYHEIPHLEKPDVICAFNPGLYRKTGFAGKDTWPETIREFVKSQAPVVVTSYTADEIFWEIERVKSVVRGVNVLLEPRQNPYASIKPDRNFVSDDTDPLIYKNYYVAVVAGGPTTS